MKNISTISKHYAMALLDAAKESGITTEIDNQLKEITEVINKSSDFRIVMANSAISTAKKIEIIDDIFGDKIDKKLLNFLKILIEKNRFNEFDAIKESFEDEISKLSNKKKVEITSPIALNFENKTNVLFKLEHKLNCDVIPTWKVDKNLIAGLKFKIDDCVIDTSIRSKIEKLSKEIIG